MTIFAGESWIARLVNRWRARNALEALLRRAGYRRVVDAALGAVRTEFP